jgi:hypothetical protein
MPVAFPMINGVRHSWSSVEIRLDNGIVLGITEINYSPKLEPGIVRGAGALPIAFTLGNAEYDGDFTILLEEFNSLEHGASSGSTDAIVRKCTVKPMSMLLNGVSPMPDQPTAAA